MVYQCYHKVVYGTQNFGVLSQGLIYSNYLMSFTMFFDGDSAKSSLTCHTSGKFAKITFSNFHLLGQYIYYYNVLSVAGA